MHAWLRKWLWTFCLTRLYLRASLTLHPRMHCRVYVQPLLLRQPRAEGCGQGEKAVAALGQLVLHWLECKVRTYVCQ